MKPNKKPKKSAPVSPVKKLKKDLEIDTESDRPTIIIFTNFTRFKLGAVAATRSALALLEQTGFSAAALLNRHAHGDWGNICKEDRESNEYAVPNKQRIISIYRLIDAGRLAATPESKRAELPTVWCITEADRSSTTILLPSEY
jgi:hypothetical protein